MMKRLSLIGSAVAITYGVATKVDPAIGRDVEIIAHGGRQILTAFGHGHQQIVAAMSPEINGLFQCAVCLLALLGLAAILSLPQIWKALTLRWGIDATRDAARNIIRELRDE